MGDNVLFESGVRYEEFVGLKDKDNYQELLTVDDFMRMLTEICTEKEISFSMLTQLGGYSHNKGYTTESSLRVVIIGIDEREVLLLADRLKQAINTDTVLVTKSEIEYCFL